MNFGVENLLKDDELISQLKDQKVALLCHAASVNRELKPSIDLFFDAGICLSAAIGPQHGIRAEKQDNMIESKDFMDPKYKIPVFSLYGEVRKPTQKMLDSFDILLIDLQDVGCRIYTFLTTLFYCMDACQNTDKQIWVLDRPNPAGRPIEGPLLNMNFASFVGAAPIPMRHGLTLGEAALWYKSHKNYDLSLKVVEMTSYDPNKEAWPVNRSWVNPSPNMPRLSCAKMYAGTVLLEGTLTSEGRGTTLPLEMFGAPGFDGEKILESMKTMAPQWLSGCLLRPCFFEPTFHKHQGQLCGGLQIHVDCPEYDELEFRPYRLIALYLKVIRKLYPNFELWRPPPYEYENKLEPIDILSGDESLRKWVDHPTLGAEDLERLLATDENVWQEQRQAFFLY